MVSNFIKVLLFIPLTAFAFGDEESKKPTKEELIYLETVNYRLNQLALLSEISRDLKLIRCQVEVSDYCDKIEQTENE